MNQIPSVPMTNPYMVQTQSVAMPVPQPKYNAVNIEINNPTVGTQGVQAPQCTTATPVYNYPQAPIYNYPQAPAPVYYPQVPQAPVVPPVAVDAPAQQPQAPVQPQVIEQQNVNYPAQPVPAPVVTEPVSVPENQPVNTEAVKPEVVPAEPVAPQVDMNAFIAKLANPDFEVQAAGMEDISTLVNESPEKATELVDSKVFDALTNIINFDGSHLEGPTKEQEAARQKPEAEQTEEEKKLANTLSPSEQAERNKCYALFTSALMQKLYADEVSRLTNTTVPLTELPGAITVVDNLKDNPSPMVRASAIEALSYIQSPAYKKDLTTVFKIAQNDSDPGVAETAKAALEKLDQIQ
ncbi:MAG: hypothetical protein NC191_08885 [Muribaculaceae bacterium]|nr:hypothetical protein [Muribaculaceae bacterium]